MSTGELLYLIPLFQVTFISILYDKYARCRAARFHPTFRAWILSASLFHDHSGRTNDMHTMAYATFRYDTAEVENWLNSFELVSTFKKDNCATV